MSEDWEKDFDLDMTEEEVQLALSKPDAAAEVPPLEPAARTRRPTAPILVVVTPNVVALHPTLETPSTSVK